MKTDALPVNIDPTALAMAELLVQLGSDVAAPLGQALERLHNQLTLTPDDSALLSLREPLRRAREATLLASQVGRLASGRVKPSEERCALHPVVRQVVEIRRREAQARGLQIRLDVVDAEVMSDPGLLPSLLHALLDWALWHTRSSIELQVGITAWPPHARLQCRFAVRDLDQSPSSRPVTLNGLRWMLVEHTAKALGVQVVRDDEAGVCVTRLEFPLMRSDAIPEIDDDLFAVREGQDTRPFAGWEVLVVAPSTDFHRRVAALMEPQGWALDRVSSVDEAFAHCVGKLPQAIVVHASAVGGADLNQWRCHVLAEAPGFCFVEVTETDSPKIPGRLVCHLARLDNELPVLLKGALAPRAESLTFRI
jgi:hypothetical protein